MPQAFSGLLVMYDCMATGAASKPYDLQSYATSLAQEAGEEVTKTNYEQVVGALQRLDDAEELPKDQLVDPWTTPYEL